jgi:hypothetical protein
MPSPTPIASETWYIDTSALITLAYHRPLRSTVVDFLQPRKTILVSSVVHELTRKKKVDPSNIYTNAAIADLSWLGTAERHEHLNDAIYDIQEDIAAGKQLVHPLEHLGESHIIAAGRLLPGEVFMVCDDHNARVMGKSNGIHPLGVHRLMHEMIRLGVLNPSIAAAYSVVLHTKRRAGRSFTEIDFQSGDLGHMGEPLII